MVSQGGQQLQLLTESHTATSTIVQSGGMDFDCEVGSQMTLIPNWFHPALSCHSKKEI